MIGMWSPWQGKRLYQVCGILCNSSMHVGSQVLMFSVAVVRDETEVISFVCWQHWQFWPIAMRLSAMAMWVLHVSNILAVVALRSRASNFLISSLSVRAWTRWNWMFHSLSSSVGKLHILARALRQSTSSSGVSPGLICTSYNWYIWHLWYTVQSIWDAKWSRKDFVLILIAATSSVVTLACVLWFHFWQGVVLRKFRVYFR